MAQINHLIYKVQMIILTNSGLKENTIEENTLNKCSYIYSVCKPLFIGEPLQRRLGVRIDGE